jgi:hypothetical protein
MQGIRVYNLVCAAICQAIFIAGIALGGEARAVEFESNTISVKNVNATNTTNQPPISVALKGEGGPGLVSTTRAYITAGTNKFAFLVPDEFKLAGCDPQKVTLMKNDGSCLISVRVIGARPGSDKPFDAAAARTLLNTEHPDGTITSEFGMFAEGVGGPAFEIKWGVGPLSRASRVGFIPLRAGLVEFSVDSSPKNLAPSLGDFNYVLLTFRGSDENGKVAATPISDQI